MAPADRTELLTVRVTPEEMAMLKKLADSDGLTASGVVRQFIRRSYVERFYDEPPYGRPKKRRRK
jgi:hypothetical protein